MESSAPWLQELGGRWWRAVMNLPLHLTGASPLEASKRVKTALLVTGPETWPRTWDMAAPSSDPFWHWLQLKFLNSDYPTAVHLHHSFKCLQSQHLEIHDDY